MSVAGPRVQVKEDPVATDRQLDALGKVAAGLPATEVMQQPRR